MKSMKKLNRITWSTLVGFYFLLITTLFVLMQTDIITVAWITGFFLSFGLGCISFICLCFSAHRLVRNENPFEFVFYALLRIGIYAIPFIISSFFINQISIFGVLIGTISTLLLIFCYKNLLTDKKTKKELKNGGS